MATNSNSTTYSPKDKLPLEALDLIVLKSGGHDRRSLNALCAIRSGLLVPVGKSIPTERRREEDGQTAELAVSTSRRPVRQRPVNPNDGPGALDHV